jgi:hypothetical protein
MAYNYNVSGLNVDFGALMAQKAKKEAYEEEKETSRLARDRELKYSNLYNEYEKTKKASQLIAVTNVRTKSKKIVQYNIKVRIEMIDNKKRSFDPNKFSLIDYQNKIRLRPVDVAYTNFTDKWHFIKLIKNKPKYKSLNKKYTIDEISSHLTVNRGTIKRWIENKAVPSHYYFDLCRMDGIEIDYTKHSEKEKDQFFTAKETTQYCIDKTYEILKKWTNKKRYMNNKNTFPRAGE